MKKLTINDAANEKKLEVRDDSVTIPGTVGPWTKADAVTHFDDCRPQEVTYHGCEVVNETIVLAANEGRSYVDSVNVKTGELIDRLTEVSKPCCIERIPGTSPVRALISNIGDGTLGVADVSTEGKLKLLGTIAVGATPKGVAFLPTN